MPIEDPKGNHVEWFKTTQKRSPTKGQDCKNRITIVPPRHTFVYYRLGWSVEIFGIGQNRSTNQRSGMILEVQIQIFGACASSHSRAKILEVHF